MCRVAQQGALLRALELGRNLDWTCLLRIWNGEIHSFALLRALELGRNLD